MRLMSSGYAAACLPTTQNVAFTPADFNMSSTCGVYSGQGPSSKVSATASVPVTLTEPAGPMPLATGGVPGSVGRLEADVAGEGLVDPEEDGDGDGAEVAVTEGDVDAEGEPGCAAQLALTATSKAAATAIG